ncbi:hypothetical protein SAMN04490244_11750 [Tranquillimonas rosea]|uniref:Uncharacterized protein n=1 Tax=Tranquillimonas rosea TaxID=641238 RepID=A0A1H9X3J6_9RHOB|nr:hypothetical protein [Tranquillimonas rosea]SES40746.1 hypothetical protein SAMN04490244_11750 [Tranquillimonas rosea]
MSVGHDPTPSDTPFLTRPIGTLFLSTPAPKAVVMSTGGRLRVQIAAPTLLMPWLLTPALLISLDAVAGDDGPWLAFPTAAAALLLLASTIVLRDRAVDPVPARASAKEAT